MSFAAVTILMDTLHQHFLQSTPSFPLRNKTKVKSLYNNLSSLQTCLEQEDFKLGEFDEAAVKALEAQIRDAYVELRFRIEHHLRLFYLGKAMKVRLHSAKNLLPILNRIIEEDIKIMDLDSVLDILSKHFTLPVSHMPPHINKRIKSFCIHYPFLFQKKTYMYYEQERVDDEQESDNEQEGGSEQECKNEQAEDGCEQESDYEQEVNDEQESKNEQEVGDEQEGEYVQGKEDEQDSNVSDEQEHNYEQESKNEQEVGDEQEGEYEQEKEDEQESNDEQENNYEQESEEEQESSEYKQESEDDEWETEEEEKSDHKQGSKDDEQEMNYEERRYMLCEEAESIIRQELRAPSYLNKYMKQRIEARQRIGQIFTKGIKLTSYIKKELLKVKNAAYHQSKKSQNNINPASPTRPERRNITVGHTSKPAIKMLGCDDEFNMIMDKLKQQSSKREIVSIVGMGGIGKTTLARRIYGDASFVSHFDCQAWVTISQEYNPKQVFQGLLHCLAPKKDEINAASSNYELVEQVYRHLKHQRYLIVVDDIWGTNVWDDLMKCFQDDNNGSRILLTTRQKNVAEYAAGSSSNSSHHKRFLGSNESWNLFCHKVLSKRIGFSPKFETIAREIVENCQGLPLAITVAAGLLSNSNQNLKEWELIAQNVLTLCLDHSNQQCENIIHLSYTFLPHHLKFCFLSLGCFPKTYEVDEDMIVDFWVSEGFLKVLKHKSLEDAAREYLQDLVDRNLVQICGGTSGEFSKVYQLHDVLRELTLGEARKENLLCFNQGSDIGLGRRRMCRYNSFTHISNTSSFIDIYNYKNLHTHFKFLRALVCRSTDIHNIFLEIMGLVHLRWLAILNDDFHFHFLPLFMLGNLQKLEVYGYSSCEPLDIWGLAQLRNLSIPQSAITLVPPRSVHQNLESIRFLDYRSCTRELFLRIPNLKALGVSNDPKINPKCKPLDWFESLVYLYKLEELVVHEKLLLREFRTIHSMGMLSLENFLPNLKKLELFRTRLRWKDMDAVGTLSKLEVLILKFGAVDGKKWEPRDGGFHRLMFLDIYDCDLQCWEASSGHFPVLECLVLRCTKLKEIPSDFADITTLKSIKLCEDFVYYPDEHPLLSSAEHIREEQREYGNDEFEVDVFRSPNACIIA